MWGDVTAIACDATGRLFGITKRSSSSEAVVLIADVYASVLDAENGSNQPATVPLSNPEVSVVLHPSPPINFSVTQITASADGHQLLVVGHSIQGDEAPVVALVDVYGSEPDLSSSSSPSPATQQQHRHASVTRVHQALHANRPGLRVLQASWHPLSSHHFALLTSDNTWRLYSSASPEEAEQSLLLRGSGAPRSSALGLSSHSRPSSGGRFVAFAFGPPGNSWASFAVLFLTAGGGVYCLCPVAPFGLRVQGSAVQQLLQQVEGRPDPEPRAWLQAAFPEGVHAGGAVLNPERTFLVRPHMLDTAAPQLQGPLNQGLESCPPKPPSGKCAAVALSVGYAGTQPGPSAEEGEGEYGAGGGQPQGAAAVLVGWNQARVYAHAMEVAGLSPAWGSALPQCSYNKRGDILGVRSECEAVAADEGGAAAGGQMLLLDVIDLQLDPAAAAAAAAASASGALVPMGRAGFEDEDQDYYSYSSDGSEKSDAGYNPAGLSESSWHQATSLNPDRMAVQLPLVRLLQLHACPELPGRFWACQEGGAWGLNLKWLPVLAKALAEAGEGLAAGLEDLPRPLLQELLLSREGVIGSSLVGSSIMGTGCVLLERLGQLSYLRPRPGAAGGSDDGALAAAAASALAGLELGAGGEPGGPGYSPQQGFSPLVMTPAAQDILAQTEEFYSDIRAGPRKLPKPQALQGRVSAAGGVGVGGSKAEVLSSLGEATTYLNKTHVTFVHMAHADLVQRASQLVAEVQDQTAVVAQLQALASALHQHQAYQQQHLAALQARQANLAERLRLVQQLHWALPRPMSKAEEAMKEQQEVWEAQHKELQLLWRRVQQRLSAVAAARRGSSRAASTPPSGNVVVSPAGGGLFRSPPGVGGVSSRGGRGEGGGGEAAGGGGGVSAAQLVRLKAALEQLSGLVGSTRTKMDLLQEDVEDYRQEHWVPELQQGLPF